MIRPRTDRPPKKRWLGFRPNRQSRPIAVVAAVLAVPLFALLVTSYQTPLYQLIDKTSDQVTRLFIDSLIDSYPTAQASNSKAQVPTSLSQQVANGSLAPAGHTPAQGTLGAVIEKTAPVLCNEIAKIKAEIRRDAALEAEQLLYEKNLEKLLPSLLAAEKLRHEKAVVGIYRDYVAAMNAANCL